MFFFSAVLKVQRTKATFGEVKVCSVISFSYYFDASESDLSVLPLRFYQRLMGFLKILSSRFLQYVFWLFFQLILLQVVAHKVNLLQTHFSFFVSY